ncbi:hypothetical protein PO909_028302, partial [Leuciscus waleckii]
KLYFEYFHLIRPSSSFRSDRKGVHRVNYASLLTIDSNIVSVFFHYFVTDSYQIKSRVFSFGVCDGQRSSLMIQLQSVSESPIRTIMCFEYSSLCVDFSYPRLLISKLPFYKIIFLYFSKNSV